MRGLTDGADSHVESVQHNYYYSGNKTPISGWPRNKGLVLGPAALDEPRAFGPCRTSLFQFVVSTRWEVIEIIKNFVEILFLAKECSGLWPTLGLQSSP